MTEATWRSYGSSPSSGSNLLPRTSQRSGNVVSRQSFNTMSEFYPDPCPFCSMPSDRVIESTDHAFAVLDAYAVSPGHTLIIARSHVASPFELTSVEIAEITQL